jgi:hypothetical protein
MQMEDGIPVLPAEPVQVREGYGKQTRLLTLWRVWCPVCERVHQHGGTPGHRAAHCSPESPFRKTGYIIKVAPTAIRLNGLHSQSNAK